MRLDIFTQAPSAEKIPRPAADDDSQKPQIRSAGVMASFEFAFSVYAVNGNDAQANGSVTASRHPPNRRPTSSRPKIASRSHAMLVKCPAGRSSHLPCQPKIQ